VILRAYRYDNDPLAPNGELEDALGGKVEILGLENDGVCSRPQLTESDTTAEES